MNSETFKTPYSRYFRLLMQKIPETGMDSNPEHQKWHELECQAASAMWERDPLLRLEKRTQVLQVGFPVSTWVHWAILQNDLSALNEWDFDNNPIDWSANLADNPRDKETLLTVLIKEDFVDWLAFAFEYGASPNSPAYRTHKRDVSVLEYCITAQALIPHCRDLVIRTHQNDLSETCVGEACIHLPKIDAIYPIPEDLGALLIAKLNVGVEIQQTPSFGQTLATRGTFLTAFLENQLTDSSYIREELLAHHQPHSAQMFLKRFEDLDILTLNQIFHHEHGGVGGAWVWFLGLKSCGYEFDETIERLLYKWDNQLKSSGCKVVGVPSLDVLLRRIEENILTENELKNGVELGFELGASAALTWEVWTERLQMAFDLSHQKEMTFDLMLNPRWEKFMDPSAALLWTAWLPEIKKEFDAIQNTYPEKLAHQLPPKWKTEDSERFNLVLATLSDHSPPTPRHTPRI